MSTELLEELVEAGVHYGHQRRKWNPKMKPYLLEERNNIYIINLYETVKQIDAAASFLAELAANGKRILFVGCKRQAQDSVREAATACNQFYINHRWLGGTLTNMSTIRKSVQRLDYLEKIEKSPEFKAMSKKELAALNRERAKLLRNLEGIRNMENPPDAVVVVHSSADIERLGKRFRSAVDPIERRAAFMELLAGMTAENALEVRKQIAHLPAELQVAGGQQCLSGQGDAVQRLQRPRQPSDILPLEGQINAAIEEAIAMFDGSIPKAAEALQVSPSTLYRRSNAKRH